MPNSRAAEAAIKRSFSLAISLPRAHQHFFYIFGKNPNKKQDEPNLPIQDKPNLPIDDYKKTFFGKGASLGISFFKEVFPKSKSAAYFEKAKTENEVYNNLPNLMSKDLSLIMKYSKKYNATFFEIYLIFRLKFALLAIIGTIFSCVLICFSCLATVYSLLPYKTCKEAALSWYLANAIVLTFTLVFFMNVWAPSKGVERVLSSSKILMDFINKI